MLTPGRSRLIDLCVHALDLRAVTQDTCPWNQLRLNKGILGASMLVASTARSPLVMLDIEMPEFGQWRLGSLCAHTINCEPTM
jgi:hypothetical protein